MKTRTIAPILAVVTLSVDGLGASFTRTFPPYSLTVLQIKAR
jgi:hypothetical protein